MAMSPIAAPVAEVEIDYPSSDGLPMAETDTHLQAMIWLYEILRLFLRARRDVYIASNMLMYFEEGNPRACRSPDVLIAIGASREPRRRSFFTWKEGVVPTVVFEVSSDSTVAIDLGAKKDLYERLGVSEYFLFDPEDDCLDPCLQGFRHDGTAFVPMELDAAGGLTSEALGLRFVPEGIMLRPYKISNGKKLLTFEEFADRHGEPEE